MKGNINKYIIGSAAINGAWKAMEMWDAKVERFVDGKMKKTDMLLGEKTCIFAVNVLIGPSILPWKMIHALNDIDIYFKKQKPEDYGLATKKKTVADYYIW